MTTPLTDAELDALCKRLRGETGDAAIASFEAADTIAALREELKRVELQRDAYRDDVTHEVDAHVITIATLNRAEADSAALRSLVHIADEVRERCPLSPATVSYDFERARINPAMLAGKEKA